MESDDCIVIERKSFEVLHIDPHLTMTAAEEHSLQELKNNLKYRRLNQYQVDKIFSTAAFSNFRCTMDFLLNPREGQLSPSSCCLANVLSKAVIDNNQLLFKYLINLSQDLIRPDQWSLNEALWNATVYRRFDMVASLVVFPPGKLRPDKNGISHAYTKAKQLNFSDIQDLLEPHVEEI